MILQLSISPPQLKTEGVRAAGITESEMRKQIETEIVS
jgi:hypothetical protein